MNDYSFHQGTPSSGFAFGFEPSLFQQPEHLKLQSPEGWHTFYLAHNKRQRVDGMVHFYIKDHVAHSPLKASFGSIEFNENLPGKVLFQFIEFVLSKLETLQVSRIVLKNAPASYNERKSALLQTFLFNHGFQVIDAEVGAVISVDATTFESKIDAWEKRKLRQAHESGLVWQELSLDHLDSVYSFILQCRKEKGYQLSMTLQDMRETVLRFPNRFLLAAVFRETEMIASSIAIRVLENVWYNFYSDHAAAYESQSPVVFLMEGLYNHCQQQQISLLDLGTSAVAGKPNFGLLDFKLRLGASPTTRLTFEKLLPS